MHIWNQIKNTLSISKKVERGSPGGGYHTASNEPLRNPYQLNRLINLNINADTTPTPIQEASGTHITYRPDLIYALEQDHQNLLQILTDIDASAKRQQHAHAQSLLRLLKKKLLGHLHLENLKLYVYLQYSLSKASEKFAEMRRFKKEMNTIGMVAMDFLNKYEQNPINATNRTVFLAELNHLGQVLGNRIKQEEQFLYPMYSRSIIDVKPEQLQWQSA